LQSLILLNQRLRALLGEAAPGGHPDCGGRAQSPIDIRTARAQPDLSLPPLRPQGYESPQSPELSLANNGHTAVLALPPSLRLLGLPRTFAAVQLHFHWGRPGQAAGAEHLLDGHRAPAEVPGDRVGDDPHPAYDNILRHLGSIRYAGQTVAIPSFSIQELLPTHLDRYYRYNGSLTTPPCFQSVIWTLFPQPVLISQAQVGPGTRSLRGFRAGSRHSQESRTLPKCPPGLEQSTVGGESPLSPPLLPNSHSVS
uniref:Carbonic anhydrase 14 n=1 Tax=Zosterops lateralis melanops TaxID=1220523 RepID=A0A8D2PYD1_ZOSLA